MQALEALYGAIICYGPFVVIGWATKRFLDNWSADRGRHASEVQGPAGSDRRQQRFFLGAWFR